MRRTTKGSLDKKVEDGLTRVAGTPAGLYPRVRAGTGTGRDFRPALNPRTRPVYPRLFAHLLFFPHSKLEYFHIKKFSKTAISTIEKQLCTRFNLYQEHTAEKKPKSNHIKFAGIPDGFEDPRILSLPTYPWLTRKREEVSGVRHLVRPVSRHVKMISISSLNAPSYCGRAYPSSARAGILSSAACTLRERGWSPPSGADCRWKGAIGGDLGISRGKWTRRGREEQAKEMHLKVVNRAPRQSRCAGSPAELGVSQCVAVVAGVAATF
ncbi:hypothetical protein DFH09DRAFT_1087874 [Mycena vulgaris]|nr:hypothetical protein DFH09DRAFT_1087874 [Mycena vulgaris]